MRLLPREEKFYQLFLKQVEIISEASRLLLDGVRTGNARMAGAATEITSLEHRGDEGEDAAKRRRYRRKDRAGQREPCFLFLFGHIQRSFIKTSGAGRFLSP